MRAFARCVVSRRALLSPRLAARRRLQDRAHADADVTIDTGERKVPFKVELAITPPEHERGLMFREHLDPTPACCSSPRSPRRRSSG
jgi:hypothetical protein